MRLLLKGFFKWIYILDLLTLNNEIYSYYWYPMNFKRNPHALKWHCFTKKIMKKKKTKSSRYHSCSNVWNSEDSNAFLLKILDFLLNFFYRCVNLEKIFKNEIYLFSFGQNMKKIIMIKIGYFCMQQKMMWGNVINLSHILCQQVQLWKLYN